MKTIKINLVSHFQRGGSVVALSGEFPTFKEEVLAAAGECTWVGDPDDSTTIIVDEDDPRPIFKTRFWGVSAHSYECAAVPLNAAARALCAQPLPKGWAVTIPGLELGGATGKARFVTSGTIADYVCDYVAGRSPVAHSPAERREAYLAAKAKSVAAWDAAGLNGAAIWAAKLPWSREEGVVELAARLVKSYAGQSRGHRHFEELNGFESPISHPRTRSAESMAALSSPTVAAAPPVKSAEPLPRGEWGALDKLS